MEGTKKKSAELQKFIDDGLWGNETWSDIWDRNAEQYPDKEALVDNKVRLTWAECKKIIDRIAFGLLELGYKKDDIIVSQYPNWFESPLLRIACEKIGVVNAPILRNWRESEVEYTLSFTGARGIAIPHVWGDTDFYQQVMNVKDKTPECEHIFISRAEAPEGTISLDKIIDTPYEDTHSPKELNGRKMPCTEVGFLTHTTGSTGFPKFAEWPASIMIERAKETTAKLEINQGSVCAAFAPAIGGLNNPVYQSAPLAAGKIVMLEKWNPVKALEMIEKEGITYFGAVPTMLRSICDIDDLKKYDTSSLKCIMVSGAAAPPSLFAETEGKIGGHVVFVYGTRELGGLAMPLVNDPQDIRILSTGKPCKWDEVKVIDDDGNEVGQGETGNVVAKSNAGFVGYFRNEKATEEAFAGGGIVHTGDLGRKDEDGNLFIMGRKKKIIIRGGENIYPVEIENLLSLHPKVNTVAIIKMPDKLMGERACAYVQSEKGETFTLEEMQAYLDEKGIAKYKWPERIELVDEMPKVGDGKVDMKGMEADIIEKLKLEGVEIE